MNKYQNAYVELINSFNYIQLGLRINIRKVNQNFSTIQELVDKETPIELETTQNEHLGIDYVCKCAKV